MHSILSHPKQTVCSISNPQQMYLMQIAVKQCVSVSNAVYKKKKNPAKIFLCFMHYIHLFCQFYLLFCFSDLKKDQNFMCLKQLLMPVHLSIVVDGL